MAKPVEIKEQHHIYKITINRPEARNALSAEVVSELDEIFSKLAHDEKTRVVLIKGEGDKTFCAGADLKERQKMSEPEVLKFVSQIQKTFQKLATLPMPTIASINADAFGGGLELALACDIRVMNQSARVGLTECGLGIIPGAGGTWRLPQLVGKACAMDLIFRARKVSGIEAKEMGLVNHLAKDSHDTKELSLKIAVEIANNAPLAVRASKNVINCHHKDTASALVAELAGYHSILESADRKEGLKAFIEKRPPQFTGA